jgi:hypothetical protein
VGAEGDDGIGADHALIAEAEAAGKIETRREGAEVGLRLASGDGEALVVVGAEASEDLVGGVEVAGVGEAEFADQAVLAGAPGALDAAFGVSRRLRHYETLKDNDSVSFILIIPGTDASLNC